MGVRYVVQLLGYHISVFGEDSFLFFKADMMEATTIILYIPLIFLLFIGLSFLMVIFMINY